MWSRRSSVHGNSVHGPSNRCSSHESGAGRVSALRHRSSATPNFRVSALQRHAGIGGWPIKDHPWDPSPAVPGMQTPARHYCLGRQRQTTSWRVPNRAGSGSFRQEPEPKPYLFFFFSFFPQCLSRNVNDFPFLSSRQSRGSLSLS